MWERLDLQNLEFHTKKLGKDMVQDVCCMPLDHMPSLRLRGIRNTPEVYVPRSCDLQWKNWHIIIEKARNCLPHQNKQKWHKTFQKGPLREPGGIGHRSTVFSKICIFFSCPMGLDLTIVIFLLKCGLYGNMPLNIPGINAKLKQTKHLSTCQEDSCLSLTILRTKHFRDWAAEMKQRWTFWLSGYFLNLLYSLMNMFRLVILFHKLKKVAPFNPLGQTW